MPPKAQSFRATLLFPALCPPSPIAMVPGEAPHHCSGLGSRKERGCCSDGEHQEV